ncbi:MAG: response regulator [Prevotellaceae bacterium]|jgi:signal transduction histidine kinase/ligand-binding sensor domain-containing protein/DNA-binding response OmpR family regulator|nr:response regulator [Prevotellaceae bacterium]
MLIFSVCNILVSVHLHAQTVSYYSSENGLSSNLINCIYQDTRGFIWIASEYGLTRFDALKFVKYQHIENDESSLNDNYVRTLFENSAGQLFTGTILGLMQYCIETDNFKNIRMIQGTDTVTAHIMGIIEVENGDLWIATSGHGLFIMRKGESFARYESSISSQLSSIYLNSIYKDSYGLIWIGTDANGVNSYNRKTREITKFNSPEKISGNNISAIAEDKNGNLFVGTLTKGLNRYDREKECFVSISSKSNNQFIYTMLLTNDNRLLIGTDGQGLKYYNAHTNTIDDIDANFVPFNLEKSKVHEIFQDNRNGIWLGLFQRGILHIPVEQNIYDYYGYRSINNNLIGWNCVMSITKDRHNTLWVSTDNDGLYGLNEKTKQSVHFHQTSSPQSISDIVLCTFEDSENNLWVAAYMKGLARVNPETGLCEYIPQLSNEKVCYITETNKKQLLIATLGSGLFVMDIESGQITHYESSKQENNDRTVDELCNDWINYILCDSEGFVWIGHYNGLSCFNPEKKTFINYLNSNNLLPGCVVNSLCEDSYGCIWIGTSSRMYRFDKSNGIVENIPLPNSKSGEMICGICEDNDGKIWFSTYYGIYKFDPNTNKFYHYYAGNGLPDNEFTRGAVFKDKKGKLYFGGTNGVTSFYPSDITEPQVELPLCLTAFYVSNKSVHKGDMSGNHIIMQTSVLDADTFHLSYSDNTFTLEFSNFDFVNAKHTIYEYMLQGKQTEWINMPHGANHVTYNNLHPGQYKFMIRIANMPDSQKTIFIKIYYPWYQTNWAAMLFVMLGIALILVIVGFVYAKIHYRHELLVKEHNQEINEAKLQFFINISHEIRTPMTLIINPLEKLLKNNTDEKTHQTYMIIYRNAQRILRLINQLMDVRKLDKGLIRLGCRETDIVGFINDLMHTFEYLSQQKNIRFIFDTPFDDLKVWIDLNCFDKIMLNILSNAFKFTGENGEIIVKLTTGRGDKRLQSSEYFEIRVIDNGIGIDLNNIERIFERFYQIHQTTLDTKFGTGIGLHLARELVKLHHGIIYAEKRNDNETGTQMVVRIPLGKEHLSPTEMETPEKAAIRTSMYFNANNMETSEEKNDKNKPASVSTSKTKYKVLVVEDEDELRKYIAKELSSTYRIKECTNGKEALEHLLKERFDAVVSDVMMPVMDGITLTCKIKQNININHIPVILLTAKIQEQDFIEGLETGADAYITKPFHTSILEQTINNLIANREILRKNFSGGQEYDDKITRIEMKSADELLMNRVMKVISDNLSNSELNVEFLANNVGMSRVHMHRKLKELTNQSARDFIRNIRMKQAALLLSENKFGIAEVAYATGFNNVSHFSTSFRGFYGMSPTEYIENLKPNKIK